MDTLSVKLKKLVGSEVTNIEFNFIKQRIIINCVNDMSLREVEIDNVIVGYLNNISSKIIYDFKITSEIGVGFWSSLDEMNYEDRTSLTQVQIFLNSKHGSDNGAIEFVLKVSHV